jgi:hypothetical protein
MAKGDCSTPPVAVLLIATLPVLVLIQPPDPALPTPEPNDGPPANSKDDDDDVDGPLPRGEGNGDAPAELGIDSDRPIELVEPRDVLPLPLRPPEVGGREDEVEEGTPSQEVPLADVGREVE